MKWTGLQKVRLLLVLIVILAIIMKCEFRSCCRGSMEDEWLTPFQIGSSSRTWFWRRMTNTIESGECLMDQHMKFAQRLLKHQYPKMNGLRLTLLQGKSQSGNITCFTGSAYWNKSLDCSQYKREGKSCSCFWFHVFFSWSGNSSADTNKFSMWNEEHPSDAMSEASGCYQLRSFAIAFVTSIAFGEDSSSCSYCQESMCAHLIVCFQNYCMELFPWYSYTNLFLMTELLSIDCTCIC